MSIIFSAYWCKVSYSETHYYFRPRLFGTWRSDSNYYAAEQNERGVGTYLVQPGIDLGVETPKLQSILQLTLNLNYHEDKSAVTVGQPADEDDYIGYNGYSMSRYFPLPRLVFGLDEIFYKTRNRIQSDRFDVPVNLNKTFINHFTPRFWYVFEPLITVGFLYRYSIVEYERQHPEDSDEHSIMLNMIHEFSRTFKADLEYLYGERFFDHTNPDYKTNRINAILLKQFKYWTFEADIGYHSRNFKGGTIEDIDIPTCRLAAMFQMPSPPDPLPKNHFPRSYLLLIADQYLDETGNEAEYYKSRRLSLKMGHEFAGKLLVDLHTSYETNKYIRFPDFSNYDDTADREDDVFHVLGQIGYRITDWMTLFLRSGHKKRNSNIAGYTYNNNYIMTGFQFSYRYFSRKYTGIFYEPDRRLDLYNRQL